MNVLLEKLSLGILPSQSQSQVDDLKEEKKAEVAVSVTQHFPLRTLVESIRTGSSICQLVAIVRAVHKAIGRDLDKSSISRVNARRERQLVRNRLATDIMKEPGLKRFLHFDGKVVERVERNKPKGNRSDIITVVVTNG